MVPGEELRAELLRRINDRVDLTAEARLRSGQRRNNFTKSDLPDDEQIHVAWGSERSARG